MLYLRNKKEQDNSCSYIQGKKKSSVLIQLSGWLRTLDMVQVTGLYQKRKNCNRTAYLKTKKYKMQREKLTGIYKSKTTMYETTIFLIIY